MITWITDNVAIGDSQDGKKADNKVFDAVLNVAIDLDIKDNFKWRYKVGLLDGPGNHMHMFMAAVLVLDALVSQDKKVLVHCHAGLSRSPIVVATWVATTGVTSLEHATEEICKLRGANPAFALRELARETLPQIKVITGRTKLFERSNQVFGKLMQQF